MRRRIVALGVALLCFPASAHAAPCAEPEGAWQASAPADQGLDHAQTARALHSYQDRRAFAVRIYRNGCLVFRDTNFGNENTLYESWEITSSVLALLAARQMTEGLLSPDDHVGALVPEADKEHGAIRVRDLLQRASGLRPQPDNVYFRDRLRLALTRELSEEPGRRFGDSPLARNLLVTVLARAARMDVVDYARRELFYPLGIRAWGWTRDRAGHPAGTFGLKLSADDLARLGELLRREGRWRGAQLIAPEYVAAMLTPSPRNHCMGWLMWLNRESNCSGSGRRLLPGLPKDLWSWAGNQDQRVTGIPSLGLLVVRYGATASDAREGPDALTWERDILLQLTAAVRDPPFAELPDRGDIPPAIGDPWRDDLFAQNARLASLPSPGPRRTRVPRVVAHRTRSGKKRLVSVRVTCPEVPGRTCEGSGRLVGIAARSKRWSAKAGETTTVLFRLARKLRAARDVDVEIHAEDEAGGVVAGVRMRITR